jgi:hypothetical protein
MWDGEMGFASSTVMLRSRLAQQDRHAELVSTSIPETRSKARKWTLKQVQGDG